MCSKNGKNSVKYNDDDDAVHMVYQERDRERKTENQVEFGKTSVKDIWKVWGGCTGQDKVEE